MDRFRDRREAGRRLAEHLTAYRGRTDVVALALPRGGVPVAYEVAMSLRAPLDVFMVRKLGVPGHEELAMGAIASGGVRVLNDQVVANLELSEQDVEAVTVAEERVLEQRERAYRGDRPPLEVAGRTVMLIDDGLATGATMRAGLAALRLRRPAALVAAAPIGSPQTCQLLEQDADEVVCALTPETFMAVGMWYEDFSQTTDEEVRKLLARAQGDAAAKSGPPSRA